MLYLKFSKQTEYDSFSNSTVNINTTPFLAITPNKVIPQIVVEVGSFFLSEENKTFDITVFDTDNEDVCRFNNKSLNGFFYKSDDTYYFASNSQMLDCFDIGCGIYYLKINDFYSEWFEVVGDVTKLLKVTVSSDYDVSNIPYSNKFKQVSYFKCKLIPPEIKETIISDIDELGEITVNAIVYRQLYSLKFYNLTDNICNFFFYMKPCDIVVEYMSNVVNLKKGSLTLSQKRSTGFIGMFDLDVSFFNKKTFKNSLCVDSSISSIMPSPKRNSDCIEYNAIQSIDINCIDDDEEINILWTINY